MDKAKQSEYYKEEDWKYDKVIETTSEGMRLKEWVHSYCIADCDCTQGQKMQVRKQQKTEDNKREPRENKRENFSQSVSVKQSKAKQRCEKKTSAKNITTSRNKRMKQKIKRQKNGQ